MTQHPTQADAQGILERERAKRAAFEEQAKPILDARVGAEVEKQVEKVNLSAARRRVEALVNQTALPVVAVKIGDDEMPWYIRRLDAEGFASVGMLSPRDSRGHIQIGERGQFAGLLAAMFYVTLCEDESGAPLFDTDSFPLAYKMATQNTPESIATNGLLFKAILKVNPEILPSTKAVKEAIQRADDDGFLEVGKQETAT